MKKLPYYDTVMTVVLVILDLLMTVSAYAIAYLLRRYIDFPTPAEGLLGFEAFLPLIGIQVLAVGIVFFFYRLYHVIRNTSRFDQVYSIFNAISIATLISIAFTALVLQGTAIETDYSRLALAYAWALNIVFVSLGRWLYQRFRIRLQRSGIGRDRLLVVGTGDAAVVVIQKLNWSPYLGYDLVGAVTRQTNGAVDVLGCPIVGTVSNLTDLIDDLAIDEVIIALPEVPHLELLDIIARCQRGQTSIKVFPDVFEIMAGEVSVDDLGGLPLLNVRDVALRGWRLALKRAVDILIAGWMLVLASPLMLAIAALIKADSPGPVFFVQERVGLDGRPFQMIKFRSMRIDTDHQGWTTKGDNRRTRIGAFIRKFSIDELPQLINVLIGDMSMVGPRPEMTRYVEQFQSLIPRYAERHREKGGITGWAQINGLRGDTSIEERIKYDLWYIENWSLWLDIKIMLRTAYKVFADRNAY